ncbi:MAG: helix-turn-helix domain-containing protein, partial [Candidatus Polarisedimenticolia bacterium]
AAPQTGEALQPGMTIAQMERRLIETTLEAAGGNRTRASEMLGISVRTLRNKLRLFREDGQEYATGVSI